MSKQSKEAEDNLKEFKKTNNLKGGYIFFIVVTLIILLWFGFLNPNSKNQPTEWKEDWLCSKFVFYDQNSANHGNNCILDNCNTIKTKENTQVDQCTCTLNNETVRRICVEQIRWRRYNYTEYTKKVN